MESNTSFKGNPSSSRDPFPQNGFNLLLNEGIHMKKPIYDGLSLNLSSFPCSFDDDFDQFQETRNVEESNTLELDTSNKDTLQECQRYDLLNLFPQTPNDLLPNESYEVGSTSNNCEPIIKGRWTHEEDSKLTELVDKYGKKRWARIAKTLGGRLGKQCRERWENHLKDNLKREVWTEEEILEIIKGHKELGSRWAELARRFPRRSQNSIKNLWNGTKRRLQNALRKTLRNGGPCRELTPLESYINSLITNEPIIVDSNNGPGPGPAPASDQIRSSNREPKNSGGDPVPVPVPDKLSGSKHNEDKAGPDQPGMSEEIYGQRETDFMELLINSY